MPDPPQHSPAAAGSRPPIGKTERQRPLPLKPVIESLPPYGVFGAVVWAVASGVDLLLGDLEVTALAVGVAMTVGLAAGGLVGGIAGGALRVTARFPGWLKAILWLCVGAGVSAWLVDTLGVMSALEGKDRELALYSLGASIASGLGLMMLGLMVHPSARRPRGFIASLRWRYRVPLLLLLSASAGAVIWADRELFVGTYPTAHLALRWGGFIVPLAVLASVVPKLNLPSGVVRVAYGLLIGVALAPLVMIRPKHHAIIGPLLEAPYPKLSTLMLRTLGDLDFDGSSAFLGGGDCNSFDPNVHPGAEEIPGNGIDDNCQLGDAINVSAIPKPESIPVPKTPAPVSFIVITVDTLRADHMGLYGYERETTPHIDDWAHQEGLVFEKAYTSGGWTSLALSSLFRGVYPRRLAWTRLHETNRFRLLRAPLEDQLRPGEKPRKAYGMPIDEPRKPLPWWLARRGMKTVAVVDDGFSEFLTPELGLAEGYDRYVLMDKFPSRQRGDAGVTQRAIRELRSLRRGAPFFMWVHYFGPHNPDSRHRDVPRFGRGAKAGYDHEVRHMDEQLGKLLHEIQVLRTKRDVAVIITSDHGEIIRGRWRNHGINLSEESIHVPLIFSAPKLEPGRDIHLVSLVDIMPTVLDMTETPIPYPQDGESLLSLLKKSAAGKEKRVILAELWRYNKRAEVTADEIVALDGFYKLEWDLDSEAKSLWRTVDRYRPRKRSYLGEVAVPHLEEAILRYLEENGKVNLSD